MVYVLGGGLLVVNLLALAAFGWDKRAARLGRRRISERRLLLVCLGGGVLGGWLGMSLFRHKTRKRGFRWRMIGVTLLWGAAVAAVGLTEIY